MNRSHADPPLAIVGPTASGKSELAMELARRARSTTTVGTQLELVSVDSMQVYRGMDIGTAKPASAERTEVPHHLIDIVEPSERFTVVDYAGAFESAMAVIAERGAVPLLVGGTGLHLRAVIDGLTPPPEFADIAAELESEAAASSAAAAAPHGRTAGAGTTGADAVRQAALGCASAEPGGAAALHRRLTELDPLAASRMEPTNLRRIVRALSVCLGTGRPFSSFGPGLQTYPEVPFRLMGIELNRDALDERIADRYRQQMEHGFLDEVRSLMAAPLSRTAAQALGYKELRAHLAGECSLDEALEAAIARTRRFARRQERWFARDPRITWIPHGSTSEMADRVEQLRGCPPDPADANVADTHRRRSEELCRRLE
ncbi:tRNA (adenosine(37)-N6)-dimethylallyltransferase [Candidatus Poriferisodalis sp.]|uniref:tRNA (adenosine(37)-N6)-dimethylallyltransferase n=1 Tax=Candidatus Poriferisodalis sp. TaxID=3101277 RepID=UPI003B0109C7